MIDEYGLQYRWEKVGRNLEMIGATTTKTGLKVECALDMRTYEKGIKVSKAQMRSPAITGNDFHPEWNYTIKPRRPET